MRMASVAFHAYLIIFIRKPRASFKADRRGADRRPKKIIERFFTKNVKLAFLIFALPK